MFVITSHTKKSDINLVVTQQYNILLPTAKNKIYIVILDAGSKYSFYNNVARFCGANISHK